MLLILSQKEKDLSVSFFHTTFTLNALDQAHPISNRCCSPSSVLVSMPYVGLAPFHHLVRADSLVTTPILYACSNSTNTPRCKEQQSAPAILQGALPTATSITQSPIPPHHPHVSSSSGSPIRSRGNRSRHHRISPAAHARPCEYSDRETVAAS